MNRDMNSFLAEQAMLLANNSVSLTQISRPAMANSKQSHQSQVSMPSPVSTPTPRDLQVQSSPSSASNLSKYSQLLLVLEEMSKDIRPTYSGSRSSAERLKRTIVHARILVRECLLETERQQSGRQ